MGNLDYSLVTLQLGGVGGASMDSMGSSETAGTQRRDLMLFSGGLVAGGALSAIVTRVGAYSIEQALATAFLVIGLSSFPLASKFFPGWTF